MAVEKITGNLFELGLPAVAHGVNLDSRMGAGIAVEFRTRYPRMFAAYAHLCRTGLFALGDVFPWYDEPDGPVVYNCATQARPGRHARLDAVVQSVEAALLDCRERGIDRLGVPRLGAGIGGLHWPDVLAALTEVAARVPEVTLVAVSLPDPGRSLTRAQGWCPRHNRDADLCGC